MLVRQVLYYLRHSTSSPSLLKNNFTGYRIPVWLIHSLSLSLSLPLLLCLLLSLLPSLLQIFYCTFFACIFSEEKSVEIFIFIPFRIRFSNFYYSLLDFYYGFFFNSNFLHFEYNMLR
jgi:hypothetical protein